MKKLNLKIIIGIVFILMVGTGNSMAGDMDMSGKWVLSIQDTSSVAHPEFVLAQEGNALTGTYKGRFGEYPVTGTANGNSFEMSYTARGSKTIYKGTVEGITMSGSASYGSGMMIVEFSGEKQ